MKRLSFICLALFSIILFSSVTATASTARSHEYKIVRGDSTYTLSGTIVNAENNDAVSDAEIEVEDSDMSASSDSDGAFTIEGLSQGTYTIKVSAEGFKETEVKVNVGDDMQPVVIKLTPEQTDDNK